MFSGKRGWLTLGVAVLATLIVVSAYLPGTSEHAELLKQHTLLSESGNTPVDRSPIDQVDQNPIPITSQKTSITTFKDLLATGISGISQDEMLELAQKRQVEMAELIESDPQRAVNEALSLAEYAALPEDVAKLVEKPFSSQLDIVVLPDESGAGSHSVGFNAQRNLVQAKLIGEKDYQQFVSFGDRTGLTSKRGLLGQGFTLNGNVVLDDKPLKVVKDEEKNYVLKHFPVALSGMEKTDFYTAASIENDPVVALAGGYVFYFSNNSNVSALNSELLKLERSIGPDTGSQLLLELAKSTDSTAYSALSFNQRVELLGREASSWSTSPKKAFYIRVIFSNKLETPVTKEALESELNGTTASLIAAMSRGNTQFTATVSDSVILLPNSSNYYLAASDARMHDDAVAAYKAQSNAVSLDDYDIIGVYFAHIGKDYTGLASIGGGNQWLQDTLSTKVIVHELGHNYGLGHANFWVRNDGGVVAGNGLSEEYGDIFDIMGSGDAQRGHFHPQALAKLGWLTTQQWQSVSQTSTHRLFRFDQQGQQGLQGLRIPRGNGDYYWLGYRGNFTDNQWLLNGLNVIWQPPGYEQSWLLDTTPGSFNDSRDDKNDSGVVIGRTYSDSDADIHITPIAKGDEWVDVQITIGSENGNSAPEVTLDQVSGVSARIPTIYKALASDPDDTELAYYWKFGDNGVYSNSSEVTYSWPTGGTKNVSVIVSDMRGKSSQSTVEVVVDDPLLQWEQTAKGLTSSNLKVIATDGTKVVIAGDNLSYGGAIVLSSGDGKEWSKASTWKKQNGSSASNLNMHFEGLTYSKDKWWLVGKDYDFSQSRWVGIILSSDNGSDWVISYYGGQPLQGITAGKNKLVAVGYEGTILSSADGITWVNRNKTNADLSGVAFGDGRFVAVGLNEYSSFTNTDGVVLSSTNGLTWSEMEKSGDLPSMSTVSYVSGYFLASGFYTGVRAMPDGETGFSLVKETNLNYGPTAFADDSNGVFLALGNTNDQYISQNGSTWYDLSLTGQSKRNALIYFKGSFISVGANGEIFNAESTSVRPPVCTQVITHAWNPETGEERNFETPCAVLAGWVVGKAPDNDADGQNDIVDNDDDNDGMPDVWEVANDLDPFDASDATSDSDGDSRNNLAEYLAGTNPQQSDAASYACNVINDPGSTTRRWGINQYNLTALPNVVAEPVFSMGQNRKIQSVACDPSGESILFSMKDSLRGDFEIFELDTSSGNITQITDNDTDDVDVTRSRDRRTIAWQKRLNDNRQAIELRRMNANGGYTAKTMASASPFVQPSLSPNGQWLTFVQLRANFFAVMRYDITNNKYKEVKSIARRKKLYHPSISDDGNKVGWSERVSQRRYRVKDMTENTIVDIVNEADGVEHAVLSGDGASVIYSVNSSDFGETHLTSLETLDTQVIGETLTNPARYLSSSWVGEIASDLN